MRALRRVTALPLDRTTEFPAGRPVRRPSIIGLVDPWQVSGLGRGDAGERELPLMGTVDTSVAVEACYLVEVWSYRPSVERLSEARMVEILVWEMQERVRSLLGEF